MIDVPKFLAENPNLFAEGTIDAAIGGILYGAQQLYQKATESQAGIPQKLIAGGGLAMGALGIGKMAVPVLYRTAEVLQRYGGDLYDLLM